jgi:hypothetical protein
MLKKLFPVLTDLKHLATIARTLSFRVRDDDPNVKDLAASALDDLLFTAPKSTKDAAGFYQTCSQVLMSMASDSAQRVPPVEDTLKIIAAKRAGDAKGSIEFDSMLTRLAFEFVALLAGEGDIPPHVCPAPSSEEHPENMNRLASAAPRSST